MGAQPVHPSSDDAVIRDLRHEARITPPLRAGEQETLLDSSALGDRGSLERLVAVNLGMVIRLAEGREARGLSVPDLVQEGSIGLVEAVRTFPRAGGGEFAAFAERKVGEQMDAAIAAEEAVVGDAERLVAAANDYERTEILLHKVLRRAPTEAELAEKLEWTLDRTRYVAQVVVDARRRQDEELLAFIDPDVIDPEAFADGLDR